MVKKKKCVVIGCNVEEDKGEEIKLLSEERRKKWIEAVGEDALEGKNKSYIWICSRHIRNGISSVIFSIFTSIQTIFF